MSVIRRPVVISEQSVAEGAASVVLSNVSIVNACLEDLLHEDELSIEAMQSYYVDYFRAQVDNGGLYQFVYNSRASEVITRFVADGLTAMGATLHSSVFAQAQRALSKAGRSAREMMLTSSYPSPNPIRKKLSAMTPVLDRARTVENLTVLNARWLLSLPDVVVLPRDQIEAHIADSVASIPHLEERRRIRNAVRQANRPTYERVILALCDHLGLTFDRITVGDPTFEYLGSPTMAWYFLSSYGVAYMVEHEGEAIASDAKTGMELGRITLPRR